MSCVGQKGSELPVAASMADSDFVIGVVNDGGVLVTKKISKSNFMTGPAGPQGPQGPEGPQGPPGVNGESSEWLYTVERLHIGHANGVSSVGDNGGSDLSSGALFNGDDNNPQGRQDLTSTTVNTNAIRFSAGETYQFNTFWMQMVAMMRPLNIGDTRSWVAFCTGTGPSFMAGGDNPASGGISYVGFRASSSAGDATWKAIAGNGVSQTVVDTGVTVQISIAETFRIEWDKLGASVRFFIGSTLVATIATTLPANGTNLRLVSGVRNLAGGVSRSCIQHLMKTRERLVALP